MGRPWGVESVLFTSRAVLYLWRERIRLQVARRGVDTVMFIAHDDAGLTAALAPVDLDETLRDRIRQALDNLWHKYFSSSTVPGLINWRNYSHQDLYHMVHTNAKPEQVGDQSYAVDDMTMATMATTDEVSQNSWALTHFWRGQAADNARATLDWHTRGGEELCGFVSSIAYAYALAAQALGRAQATMPKPVNTDDGTNLGELAGLGAAGPPGWVVRKCVADQAAADAKEQAVEVMEAYERDLHDAYRQVRPPATLPPGVEHGSSYADDGGGDTGPPVVGRRVPRRTIQGGGSSPAATQQSSTVSAVPGVRADRAVAPVEPIDGSAGTTAASAMGPAVRSPRGPATDAGGPAAWRDLTGKGALPGLLSGGARPGAPGARVGRPSAMGLGQRTASLPGMSPSGAGSPDDEDTEHHNKMPRGQHLFTFNDGQALAPPVIGDWSRGADDD